jgi:hypothetical protein
VLPMAKKRKDASIMGQTKPNDTTAPDLLTAAVYEAGTHIGVGLATIGEALHRIADAADERLAFDREATRIENDMRLRGLEAQEQLAAAQARLVNAATGTRPPEPSSNGSAS